MKFYLCEHCGNIVTYVRDRGVPVVCCGQKMTELVPGSVDAAVEKHVPVVSRQGTQVVVNVGGIQHPMAPEHYIEWIALETEQGSQLKHLAPGDKPERVFALAEGDRVIAAYAYCNLHGLWKA